MEQKTKVLAEGFQPFSKDFHTLSKDFQFPTFVLFQTPTTDSICQNNLLKTDKVWEAKVEYHLWDTAESSILIGYTCQGMG